MVGTSISAIFISFLSYLVDTYLCVVAFIRRSLLTYLFFLQDAQRLRVRGQHLLPLARRRRLPALHGPDVHRGTPPLSLSSPSIIWIPA